MLKIQEHWWGFSLYIFGIFALLDITKWLPLRFWRATSGEHFVDTKQILNSVDCLNKNLTHQSIDFCTNYVYGKTLLRVLKFLHINPSLTGIVGYVFLGFLSIVLGYLWFKTHITFLTGVMVIFSPPILLLAERANFDTIMFVLVVSATLLSFREKHVAAILILGLASAFKFYTLPLMLISVIFAKGKFQRAFILTATGLLAYELGKEISASKKIMNPAGATAYNNGQGFGFNIWAGYLPRFKAIFPVENTLVGVGFSSFIIFLIGIVTFTLIRKKSYWELKPVANEKNLIRMFEFYLIVHVSCFFAGISIDYRLIFILATTLSYLGATKSLNTGQVERNMLLVMLIVSLWCSYPSDGLQIIGDISLASLTIILVIQAVRLRILHKHIFGQMSS